MSDTATKNDLQNLGKNIDSNINNLEKRIDSQINKAVDDLSEVIKTFMFQVDDRFNKLEAKVDAIDDKYGHLIKTIDGFLSRIDQYESEQAARDRQFDRLLVWARKVSEKTGIPLENL